MIVFYHCPRVCEYEILCLVFELIDMMPPSQIDFGLKIIHTGGSTSPVFVLLFVELLLL